MLCPLVECLLVQQDCPADERCVPTVIDDGAPWYGATCVPAPLFPHAIGDACTSDSPWQDNCEPSAFCVADDRGVGTCAAICDPDNKGACGADTCSPCDFVEQLALAGVCGATEVAC